MAIVFDDSKIKIGDSINLNFTNSRARAITGNVAGVFGHELSVEYRLNGRRQVYQLEAEDVIAGAVVMQVTNQEGEIYDPVQDGGIYDDGTGGGGTGGTTNYNLLQNRPQINGTTLQGNQTAAQLGLAAAADLAAEVTRATGVEAALQTQINTINASPYTHQQNTAAAVWTIPHNLGKQYVDVQIIDSAGNTATADITYTSTNIVTLTFSIPVNGTAIIRR